MADNKRTQGTPMKQGQSMDAGKAQGMKPDQQGEGMNPDRTEQRAPQRDDRDRQRMGQSQSPAGQKPTRATDKNASMDQNADRTVSADIGTGKDADADEDNEETDDVE